MTAILNSILSVMLGWVRSIAASIWSLLSGTGADWLRWISENWLMLTIILLVGCTIIDLIVYLLRWRPNRVWSTFFQHRFHRKRQDAAEQVKGVSRRWLYADGSSREEIIPEEELPVAEPSVQPAWQETYETPAEPEITEPENIPVQPVMNDLQEIPEPTPSTRRRRSDVYQAAAPQENGQENVSPVKALRNLFSGPDENEEDLSYKYTPAQSVDGYAERFNKPYYPPKYQHSEQHDSDPS